MSQEPPFLPARLFPFAIGGFGILLGLVLGYFLANFLQTTSREEQKKQALLEAKAEAKTSIEQAQQDAKKEETSRIAAEQSIKILQAKVEVGNAIELCLQAFRELRNSNFGFVSRDLQLAQKSIALAESFLPDTDPNRKKLLQLYRSFESVLTLVLQLEKKEVIETKLSTQLRQLQTLREQIVPNTPN